MIALPPDGIRVNPAQHASAMPKLVSPNTAPVVLAPADTHHYRFLGIEFKAAAGINSNGLIVLGLGNETTLTRLPHHFEFDRVYVHGDPVVGGKRGIQLNSASTTIMNSYIADIKRVGQDTQAICGWNGPGPFRIINNYLEAAGENVMFGGADPAIPRNRYRNYVVE